jgi:GAF domain-containing protein
MQLNIVKASAEEAMKMLEDGAPQHKILAHLVTTAETIADGDVVSSILIVDQTGLLRNGASPGLPHDYLTAIDGLKPNPNLGTCAAVAATGNMVITRDFCADDKWAELKHLPLALGFLGAWSLPIKSSDGKVLGTFGTYFREKREPSTIEIEQVQVLADTAARILTGTL